MVDYAYEDWSPRFNFGNYRGADVISGICIHVTVNSPGTPAENVATYQINSESGSYHELVDTRPKVIKENTDDWLTWSAGPTGNKKFLHRSYVMRGTESTNTWLQYDAMLRAGAQRDAEWATKYNIPVRKISAQEVRAGARGFMGHYDVSMAFNESDHVDPGPGFPWDYYLKLVREYQNNIASNNNAIEAKAKELNLGNPLTDERVCPDKVGRNRVYKDAIVYWTPNIGANAVRGENLKKYADIGYERGVLGYPTTGEVSIRDGGVYQRFERGNMYFTPRNGSKIIYGAIFGKWSETDYEKGILGYPLTDEMICPDGNGRYNHFENGSIYWTKETGAHEVHGRIRDAWAKAGWEKTIGYPITDERKTPNKLGAYNHFQNGSIYFKFGAQEAVIVPKWIMDIWGGLGYENGKLGFPIIGEHSKDGYVRVDFESGSIGYDKENDKTMVCINGKWEPVKKVEPVKDVEKQNPVGTNRPTSPVNSKFIDYSSGVPSAKSIKSAGYKGVIRYISPAREAWMKGKPMSKQEFDDMKANGLQVAFVFQNLKNDWHNGFVGGVGDAKKAQEHLNYLGVPNAVVYCVIDSNLANDAGQALNIWNSTAAEYIKGFQSVIGKDRTGIYANKLCIDWAIEDNLGSYYWQHDWTNIVGGKQNTGVNPNAHIHQLPFKHDSVDGIDVDENVVCKEYFGQV